MTKRDLIYVYAGNPGGTSTSSPFTITQNLYAYLSQHYHVHYLDWQNTGPIPKVDKNTTILAHPNYPQDTPAWKLFDAADQAGSPHKYLIFPFHHGQPHHNLPFDPLVARAKHIFSITGPYWYDTIATSPFAHWAPKITRLDMAIDPNHYPYVKRTIKPPGARTYCHIGSDRPEKGLPLLIEIFRRLPQYTLHIYGNISHDTVHHHPNIICHGHTTMVPQFGQDLCDTAELMINTSVSDANPTTLLEAAAWGLPVACTPQSGYWPDQPFWGLNPNDIDGIINLLHHLQTAPPETFWQQSKKQRKVIETNHTWHKFCTTIHNQIVNSSN